MTAVIRTIEANTANKADTEHLRRYFAFVKRRFAALRQKNGHNGEELVIALAGRPLALELDGTHFYEQAAPSFACLRAERTGAEESLFVWRDDAARYCPPLPPCPVENYDHAIWRHESPWAEFHIPANKAFMRARHLTDGEFYFCLGPDYTLDPAYMAHPLRPQLHHWARTHNLMLLHGAAVEIDGCGIFLAASGGRGKTSFAVSALLAGHSYAADDYVLLDTTPTAHPIYSSAYLNRDMLAKMPHLRGDVLYVDPVRDKILVDLSAYASRIKGPIPLHMVLAPHVSGQSTPSLEKVAPARAVWPTIRTSAAQNGAMHDTAFKSAIFATLGNLPAYRINLSPDLDKNIRLIENFIKKNREIVCTL